MDSKTMWIAYLVIKGKKHYDYASIRLTKTSVKEYIASQDYLGEAGYKISKVTVTIKP